MKLERPNEKDTPPIGLREWDEWDAVEQLDQCGEQIQAVDWEAYVREVTALAERAAAGWGHGASTAIGRRQRKE